MTTGFHTYGVDVEPDTITWYFDRKPVWHAATYAAARRPLFVLFNLALGGGTHNNADGSAYDWPLTPNPTDLKVKYVAIWASPNSPNFPCRLERPVLRRPTPARSSPPLPRGKVDWQKVEWVDERLWETRAFCQTEPAIADFPPLWGGTL